MVIFKAQARRLALILPLALLSLPGSAETNSTRPSLKVSYALTQTTVSPAFQEEDLWARIRAGFSLGEPNPALIRAHEQWYAKRPAHLERVIERSRPYLFHIVEEVEKRGMPMEIALLPIIESAFDPKAESPAKASGIWQFIPATGRVYGLKQNEWFDGRRDILQSTRAALDYLGNLHAMFGDWELALAAYNCGEGCVQRAQRASGRRDYASLRLPTETRHYVPKLVAVRNIVRDPESFGLRLDAIANDSYFMQVRLQHPIEARQAAKLAEMSLDEFLLLNPAFKRRVIHTDTRGVLLLPADRIETFQFNLHQKGADKRLRTYSAHKGENLADIARKFGVSLAWLREHNPVKTYKGQLTVAQTLVVPGTVGKATPTAKKQARAEPGRRTYTVKTGDTLDRVAQLHNVRIADLRRLNENVDPLMPGSVLAIPEISS